MVSALGVVTLAMSFAVAGAQGRPARGSPPPVERLMIGPDQYLVRPDPLPLPSFLTAASPASDSVHGRTLVAPHNWGVANARPCRPVAVVDTSGWRATASPYTLGVLPPMLTPDTSFRAYHGGLRWAGQGMTFTVTRGWWGIGYDSVGRLLSCRVTARTGEYIVHEVRDSAGFAFTAIRGQPVCMPSVVITGRAPSEAALRVLWTALMVIPPIPSGQCS
jgi:hypothetical protein